MNMVSSILREITPGGGEESTGDDVAGAALALVAASGTTTAITAAGAVPKIVAEKCTGKLGPVFG